MLSWLRASSVTMNGENPYTRPPSTAAGAHRTQRRSRTNIDRADSTGARVRATFIDATGPANHVTGASTTPSATTLVSSSRLTPPGWNRYVE